MAFNPHCVCLCQQMSLLDVLRDFLAYLKEYCWYDEIDLCRFLVLYLLCGTIFESENYATAISGFQHLFCTENCIRRRFLGYATAISGFQHLFYTENCIRRRFSGFLCKCKCPHLHPAIRRTFFLDSAGFGSTLVDLFCELRDDNRISDNWNLGTVLSESRYYQVLSLMNLSWQRSLEFVQSFFWSSNGSSIPHHYQQRLEFRLELIIHLPSHLHLIYIYISFTGHFLISDSIPLRTGYKFSVSQYKGSFIWLFICWTFLPFS